MKKKILSGIAAGVPTAALAATTVSCGVEEENNKDKKDGKGTQGAAPIAGSGNGNVEVHGHHAQVRLLVKSPVTTLTDEMLQEVSDQLAASGSVADITSISVVCVESLEDDISGLSQFVSDAIMPGQAGNFGMVKASLAKSIPTPQSVLGTTQKLDFRPELEALLPTIVDDATNFISTKTEAQLADLLVEFRNDWTPVELGLNVPTIADSSIKYTFENISIYNGGDLYMMATVSKNGQSARAQVQIHSAPPANNGSTDKKLDQLLASHPVMAMKTSTLSEAELKTLLATKKTNLRASELGITNPAVPTDINIFYNYVLPTAYNTGTLEVNIVLENTSTGTQKETGTKIKPATKVNVSATMPTTPDVTIATSPTEIMYSINYNSKTMPSRELSAQQLVDLFSHNGPTGARVNAFELTDLPQPPAGYEMSYSIDSLTPGQYRYEKEILINVEMKSLAGLKIDHNTSSFKIVTTPYDFSNDIQKIATPLEISTQQFSSFDYVRIGTGMAGSLVDSWDWMKDLNDPLPDYYFPIEIMELKARDVAAKTLTVDIQLMLSEETGSDGYGLSTIVRDLVIHFAS